MPLDSMLVAAGFHGCPIPSRMMSTTSDAEVISALIAQRRSDPATFGSTAPHPGPLRLPAEFERKSELHLVFPGWLDHETLFQDVLAATWAEGEVHVHLMHPGDRSRVRSLANQRGVPSSSLRVHSGWPVESIWIRDYGPMSVERDGGYALVDWIYALDCMDDDALPTRFGEATGREVSRPALVLDGGNLTSDGEGTCFTTTGLLELNEAEPEDLEAVLRAYTGCRELVVLEPLSGNVIDHVDQLLAVAPDGRLLLAMPDPLLDPVNHEVMQRNRTRLEHTRRPDGRSWTLLDVPMPAPGTVRGEEEGEPLVVSYLNLLPFNGVVVVPTFADDQHQELALKQIASAYPGRRIVPVRADRVASNYGAVHCVTLTLP